MNGPSGSSVGDPNVRGHSMVLAGTAVPLSHHPHPQPSPVEGEGAGMRVVVLVRH